MIIRTLLSYITLFILWVVLSGHFEFFFMVSGVMSCLFTILLCRRLFSSSNNIWNKSDRLFFFYFITYVGWIVYQVVLSCFYIMKKVWQVNISLSPEIIVVKSQQKNGMSLTLFAGSVTLTPGTVSVDVISEDPCEIIICVIDKELIDGVSSIDYRVKQLFYSLASFK